MPRTPVAPTTSTVEFFVLSRAICLFCVLTMPSCLLFAVEFWNGESLKVGGLHDPPTQISKPHGSPGVVSRNAALDPILWIICKRESCRTAKQIVTLSDAHPVRSLLHAHRRSHR